MASVHNRECTLFKITKGKNGWEKISKISYWGNHGITFAAC
jgi:hypothetical protein